MSDAGIAKIIAIFAGARTETVAEPPIRSASRFGRAMLEHEIHVKPGSSKGSLMSVGSNAASLVTVVEDALELAPKVVKVGNCSGRNLDKFAALGLTPVPAERVVISVLSLP